MMITNDIRREVAAKMRESSRMFDFSAHNIALDIGMDDPSDFCDGFDVEHIEAWQRLIDLIEPGEQSVIAEVKLSDEQIAEAARDAVSEAGMCDREQLLFIADELDVFADLDHADGENVRDTIRLYAWLIRRACGEGEVE